MPDLNETLNDRGKDYGDFPAMAAKIDSIQTAMRIGVGWNNLSPYQKHALDMIAVKIGRILAGNPYKTDNWHDIQGYAKLVEEMLGDTS